MGLTVLLRKVLETLNFLEFDALIVPQLVAQVHICLYVVRLLLENVLFDLQDPIEEL